MILNAAIAQIVSSIVIVIGSLLVYIGLNHEKNVSFLSYYGGCLLGFSLGIIFCIAISYYGT
ncbi:hypothetical protein SDC9_190580 [bioreactor metagenome]|uniref:Uncharacterized protein n=1 Tax=bioreactor metagenome TaxID=1076179 RepID=A0A645HVD6_9ZZZZ